jgi:excisionase family DNA binding protein
MPDGLSVSKAAELLEIHPSTLKRWEREGKIPKAKRAARTNMRIYTQEDVEKIRRIMQIGVIIQPS